MDYVNIFKIILIIFYLLVFYCPVIYYIPKWIHLYPYDSVVIQMKKSIK
jgi:hypothetical protein